MIAHTEDILPAREGEAAPQGSRVARVLFVLYKQALSPALHSVAPSQCKHLPTCSEYAYVAVARHGWLRGSWLALRRLARCHPWAEGGFDPVP